MGSLASLSGATISLSLRLSLSLFLFSTVCLYPLEAGPEGFGFKSKFPQVGCTGFSVDATAPEALSSKSLCPVNPQA